MAQSLWHCGEHPSYLARGNGLARCRDPESTEARGGVPHRPSRPVGCKVVVVRHGLLVLKDFVEPVVKVDTGAVCRHGVREFLGGLGSLGSLRLVVHGSLGSPQGLL